MSEIHRLPPVLRRAIARALARPASPKASVRNRAACLYKVDRLGDFVIALGALRLLIEHFGETECRLIVGESAANLAAAEFPGVDRHVLPSSVAGVWRELRPLRNRTAPLWAGETFRHLICLRHSGSLYRDVTLQWIHAERWHGLGPRPAPGSLTLDNRPVFGPAYPVDANAPWCRELLAHRRVVAGIIGRDPDWNEMRPQLRSVIATANRDIVFCPFGSEPIRDYPAANWIEAWRANAPAFAQTSVHLCGPADRRDDLTALANQLRASVGIENAVVCTNLPGLDFVRLIAGAKAVVTVESAAAHLATAMEKPAVIVCGGGHAGIFAPWSGQLRQHWLFHRLECYGCNWNCRFPKVRCLAELPPGEVGQALQLMMQHG